MNDVAITKRLPSVDWIAFGVAVGASALGYVVHQFNLLVPLAVFTPSLLRELRVLRDGDEYTREVMHRAGFHALLVTALLVFATWGVARPGATPLGLDLLTGETLRKVIMYTFVVSYLLQYWGGREGSFRILLGMALWNLMPIIAAIARPSRYPDGYSFMLPAIALAIVGLAFLVRRWPRLGGAVLALIFVLSVIQGASLMQGPHATNVGGPSILLQACIFPGAMAVALLANPRGADENP